jgi:hypothetical protein
MPSESSICTPACIACIALRLLFGLRLPLLQLLKPAQQLVGDVLALHLREREERLHQSVAFLHGALLHPHVAVHARELTLDVSERVEFDAGELTGREVANPRG